LAVFEMNPQFTRQYDISNVSTVNKDKIIHCSNVETLETLKARIKPEELEYFIYYLRDVIITKKLNSEAYHEAIVSCDTSFNVFIRSNKIIPNTITFKVPFKKCKDVIEFTLEENGQPKHEKQHEEAAATGVVPGQQTRIQDTLVGEEKYEASEKQNGAVNENDKPFTEHPLYSTPVKFIEMGCPESALPDWWLKEHDKILKKYYNTFQELTTKKRVKTLTINQTKQIYEAKIKSLEKDKKVPMYHKEGLIKELKTKLDKTLSTIEEEIPKLEKELEEIKNTKISVDANKDYNTISSNFIKQVTQNLQKNNPCNHIVEYLNDNNLNLLSLYETFKLPQFNKGSFAFPYLKDECKIQIGLNNRDEQATPILPIFGTEGETDGESDDFEDGGGKTLRRRKTLHSLKTRRRRHHDCRT